MREKEILLKDTANGKKIVVMHQEHDIILNSAVDPDYASEVFAEGYQKELHEYDVVFMFGLSDGRVLEKLVEKVSNTITFVVYEPNRDMFSVVQKNFDIKDTISKNNVYIYLEKKDENNMERIFHKHVNYYNCNKIRYIVLPNYNLVYSKELEIYRDKLLYVMNECLIQKNTTMTFENEWRESGMLAMQKAVKMQDIYGLKEEMDKYDISGAPAIIVCAGPSLDKNIKEIKRAEGKSFIIVVDAALRATSKYGIQADMGINIDGSVPVRFFDGSKMSQIPMVVCSMSSKMLLEDDSILKFLDGSCNAVMDRLELELLNRKNQKLLTGGSVSTDAFSLAVYLGFKTIIYVGQDLSYPEGKLHNEVLALGPEQNKEFVKNIEPERRREVEDVYGNTVLTDIVMEWYRGWFESKLREMPEINLIDATEGGAKIKGSEIMTLRNAIDRECQMEIDFKAIIGHVPDKYTDDQKEIVIGKLKGERERLRNVQEELKNAVIDYETLIGLVKRGREKSRDFQQLYQKAIGMTDFENREPTYALLRCYNLKQIYEEDTDIYERDYTLEELLVSAKNMFQGYLEAIELYLEDYQKIVLDKL